jgi:hypothetical protein
VKVTILGCGQKAPKGMVDGQGSKTSDDENGAVAVDVNKDMTGG